MRRFSSSLHPRDRNGKFTNKAGSNRSSGNRVTKAAKVKASTPATPNQISRAQRDIRVARVANTAAHSYASATAAQQSGALIGAAFAASSAGAGTPLLAVMGAKATIKGAKAINEAHRVRSINSKKYRDGTIEERSKFDENYGKRAKVINRADTATTVVGFLHIASTPLIKERAATQNYRRQQEVGRRVASDQTRRSFVEDRYPSNLIPKSGMPLPKAARKKRSGAYDITTAGGKRVA